MMTKKEKIKYKINRIFQMLINALGIGMGLLIIVISTGIIDENKIEPYPHFIVIGIVSILLSSVLSFYNHIKCIDTFEQAYKDKDKNYYADIDE